MKQWHLARIGCAIALSWQAAVLGQPRELGYGVEWLPGGVADGMPIDGNSVLIEAPDGWIIVDSGRRPAHAQALLERVRASGKPLRRLINTQSQLDHAGGNATLRDAFPSLRVMAGDADLATPDVVVRERATVELAGLGLGIGVERPGGQRSEHGENHGPRAAGLCR